MLTADDFLRRTGVRGEEGIERYSAILQPIGVVLEATGYHRCQVKRIYASCLR